MKIILDSIFKLDVFNKFNVFFAKKLIKYSKIFFVKTNLINLPDQNHPLKLNFEQELKKITAYKNNPDINPFISYSHLIDLLAVYSDLKKKYFFLIMAVVVLIYIFI